MVVLRCTREVLDRVGHQPVEPAATSTTRLGDWYVALVRVRAAAVPAGRQRTDAAPGRGPRPRRQGNGAPRSPRRSAASCAAPASGEDEADAECAARADDVFAPTRNRSLLGTVNDFAFSMQLRLRSEPDTPLDDLALWLAVTPIRTRFHSGAPEDVTRQLFGLEKRRRTLTPPELDVPPAPVDRTTPKRPRQAAPKRVDAMPMDLALFAEVSAVQRCEYLEGAMHGSPAPNPAHQHAALRVARALEDYFSVRDREALVLVGPVPTFLDDRTVAQPDVVVVKRRQLSRRGVEGAPQLIVEIVTAASAERDREVKVRVYAEAGVERYWLVDVEQQVVECLGRRLPGTPAIARSTNLLKLEDFPGFELRLDTLWL